ADQIAAAERIDDGLRDRLGDVRVEPLASLDEVLRAERGEPLRDRLAVLVDDLLPLLGDRLGAAARGDAIQQLGVVDEVVALAVGVRDAERRGDERECNRDCAPHQLASATAPSYILSRSPAYFFSTTLRLTLRLGVSSP